MIYSSKRDTYDEFGFEFFDPNNFSDATKNEMDAREIEMINEKKAEELKVQLDDPEAYEEKIREDMVIIYEEHY